MCGASSGGGCDWSGVAGNQQRCRERRAANRPARRVVSGVVAARGRGGLPGGESRHSRRPDAPIPRSLRARRRRPAPAGGHHLGRRQRRDPRAARPDRGSLLVRRAQPRVAGPPRPRARHRADPGHRPDATAAVPLVRVAGRPRRPRPRQGGLPAAHQPPRAAPQRVHPRTRGANRDPAARPAPAGVGAERDAREALCQAGRQPPDRRRLPGDQRLRRSRASKPGSPAPQPTTAGAAVERVAGG